MSNNRLCSLPFPNSSYLNFSSFSLIILTILSFHIHFIINGFITDPAEILIGITLDLLLDLWKIDILIILKLSVYEHALTLNLFDLFYVSIK